jgi:transcriptional regulator with XRE-family HTH domain
MHGKRSSVDNAPMSRGADPDRNARAQAFGENLRDARREAELSQDELAGHADIDRGAISTYEHGKREPNPRTIVKLAHALGVPAGTLLRGL